MAWNKRWGWLAALALLAVGLTVQASLNGRQVPRQGGVQPASDSAWRLPPIRLPDLQGEVHGLDEWRGKVIILNFWATWCPPCQYETPDLIRYQGQYGARGLQVIGVGLDEARRLGNFRRHYGINYPILVSGETRGAKLMEQWGNRKGIVPYTVVIAPDGHIAYRRSGQFGDTAFEDFVLPLLGSEMMEQAGR